MKFITAMMLTVAMAFSAPVFAQDAAKDAEHAAAVAAAQKASSPAAQNVKNEFVVIADGLADALTSTAHKLNVELQDFATSPLGLFTMAIVVYHFAGDVINQWASALVFFFLTGSMWLYWTRKTFGVYDEKNKFVKYQWWDGKVDAPVGAIFAFLSAIVIMVGLAIKLP